MFLGLLGGLALFLLGIKIMSSTFEKTVSTSIRTKLYKITSNKILGVILGLVMTGLLQSSSATTLIVISLVHGNLINIYSAVPIIMGANIGTTLTGQLLSFNIDSFTPYLLLLGIVLTPLLRKEPYKVIPQLLLSLGLIFSGMKVMGISIAPLKSSRYFATIITNIGENNNLGIMAGFFLTAIIQSSSTGIAILQIMASSNIIPVLTAIPIILGQNIGTCVDTLIGSFAVNTAGKQTAIVHILFNIIGVIVFYPFVSKLYHVVEYLSPDNVAKQVANAHTIFNIVTTILLLPFSSFLVNIAKKIIKTD